MNIPLNHNVPHPFLEVRLSPSTVFVWSVTWPWHSRFFSTSRSHCLLPSWNCWSVADSPTSSVWSRNCFRRARVDLTLAIAGAGIAWVKSCYIFYIIPSECDVKAKRSQIWYAHITWILLIVEISTRTKAKIDQFCQIQAKKNFWTVIFTPERFFSLQKASERFRTVLNACLTLFSTPQRPKCPERQKPLRYSFLHTNPQNWPFFSLEWNNPVLGSSRYILCMCHSQTNVCHPTILGNPRATFAPSMDENPPGGYLSWGPVPQIQVNHLQIGKPTHHCHDLPCLLEGKLQHCPSWLFFPPCNINGSNVKAQGTAADFLNVLVPTIQFQGYLILTHTQLVSQMLGPKSLQSHLCSAARCRTSRQPRMQPTKTPSSTGQQALARIKLHATELRVYNFNVWKINISYLHLIN